MVSFSYINIFLLIFWQKHLNNFFSILFFFPKKKFYHENMCKIWEYEPNKEKKREFFFVMITDWFSFFCFFGSCFRFAFKLYVCFSQNLNLEKDLLPFFPYPQFAWSPFNMREGIKVFFFWFWISWSKADFVPFFMFRQAL